MARDSTRWRAASGQLPGAARTPALSSHGPRATRAAAGPRMQVRSPGGHESPGGRHGHLPRQRDAFPRGVPLSPGVLTCTLGPGPQCPPRGQERIQQDLRARPLGTALRGRTDPLEETGSSGALGPPAAGPPSPLHRPAPDCDLSLALSDLCPPQRSCSPPPPFSYGEPSAPSPPDRWAWAGGVLLPRQGHPPILPASALSVNLRSTWSQSH